MPHPDPLDPTTPRRYRRALYHLRDGFMPDDFADPLGAWFEQNWQTMEPVGDGVARWLFEIPYFDQHYPEVRRFTSRLLDVVDEAAAACRVPAEFPVQRVELHAVLFHHRGFAGWHTGARGPEGAFEPTRRLAFAYFLHSEPKLFDGGELEFQDGTRIEPVTNRLVLLHPLQRQQTTPVRCWSPEMLHGRFALTGWIHGPAPEGYLDLARDLTGEALDEPA